MPPNRLLYGPKYRGSSFSLREVLHTRACFCFAVLAICLEPRANVPRRSHRGAPPGSTATQLHHPEPCWQVRCAPGAGNEGKELELSGDAACGTSLHPASELAMPVHIYRRPRTESQGSKSWFCKMPKEKRSRRTAEPRTMFGICSLRIIADLSF